MPCSLPPDGYSCIGADAANDRVVFPVHDGAQIVCAPLAAREGFLELLRTNLPNTAKVLEASSRKADSLGDLRYKYFPNRFKPLMGTCLNGKASLCDPPFSSPAATLGKFPLIRALTLKPAFI